MAKTKMKKQETNEFNNQLKLYLSSLSSRLNDFVFFNLEGVEDSLLIGNGDTELLSTYAPASLSLHLLTFKNTEFINKLKDILKIPSNIPYCLKSKFIRKAIKDNDISDFEVVYNNEKNMMLKNMFTNTFVTIDNKSKKDEEDSEEEDNFDNDEITSNIEIQVDKLCGFPVLDMYSLNVLETEANKLKKYSEDYFKSLNKKYIVNEYPNPNAKPYLTNIYRTENITADMLDLKIPNMNTCFVLFVDGQDIVSIKEFIKKTKGSCKQYIWSENGTTIKNMAIYEDDQLVVKSCRPFSEIIPIPKNELIRIN